MIDLTIVMVFILPYIIFCIIVGAAASNRGRSGFGYFILSLLLSPLIAFIIIIALGDNKKIRRNLIYEDAEIRESISLKYKNMEQGSSAFRNVSDHHLINKEKKCPFCANLIKYEAIFCMYCHKEIDTTSQPGELENIDKTSDGNYLSFDFVPTHKVKLTSPTDELNLRRAPNMDLKPFFIIPNNTVVQYINRGEDLEVDNFKAPWFQIITKEGFQGWCFSGHLEILENEDSAENNELSLSSNTLASTHKIITKTILRSGPGNNYERIAILEAKENVFLINKVVNIEENIIWYNIKSEHNNEGWCIGDVCREI